VKFLLVRVDDRLLHGQVVYGWGGPLRPRRYLIVDDRAASDAWEREAYTASAVGAPVEVLDLERFAQGWRGTPDAAGTLVLLRDLAGLHRLWVSGFRPEGGVNLGGIHARAGTRPRLSFIHLTEEEERTLGVLLAAGCDLHAQELPGTPRHDVETIRTWVREA
jgi:PTS system mannose-specific IIB component/fructoselysine and glucoselysine-specific PTS system IIB component